MAERRVQFARSERLDRTKAEIAARIKPVCLDWCEERFDTLVTQAALIEIKYTLRRMLPECTVVPASPEGLLPNEE
jgi:hypothetical protein